MSEPAKAIKDSGKAADAVATGVRPGSPDEAAPPARDWKTTFRHITNTSTVTVILAVVVALVIGAIMIAASDSKVQQAATYLFGRPGDFFAAVGHSVGGAYSALFQGAVFNLHATSSGAFLLPLTNSIAYATPLIFAGLALAMGFRGGLFNIGGQGQITLGAVLCAYIGFGLHLPAGLHVILALVGAFVGGAIWGFIPGILKAVAGANEVIVTIMLNAIAGFLISYLLTLKAFKVPGSNNPISPIVDKNAQYPSFFGTSIDVGFILAVAAAVGVWWLMERSTLGFRIRAVGENRSAAKTAGMSVSMTYVWLMIIGGGLCGLAATSPLMSHPAQALSAGVASTFGFDAITVALLGRSKPLGVVFAGLLFGGLRAGGYMMQAGTGTPIDIILVLQSVIVLLIAAPPLVKAIFRLPDPERRKRVKAIKTAPVVPAGLKTEVAA